MLNLDPGEYVIARMNDVSIERGGNSNDIVLTNQHLVIINKTLFAGRQKNVVRHRLDQIPIINGRANVKMDNLGNLFVQLKTGEKLEIYSSDKSDCAAFVSQINLILTGTSFVPNEKEQKESNEIANAFQSAFAVLDPRTYFGDAKNPSNQQQPYQQHVSQTPQPVSTVCIGCHAPISGFAGQSVTCGYCDTVQKIQGA